MIELNASGWGTRTLTHLVTDLNGTLALDGVLLPGVADRLADLSLRLRIHVCTSDIHSSAREQLKNIDHELHVLVAGDQARQKADLVIQLGPLQTVAMGQGRNDFRMLQEATVGIAILGEEGCAVESLQSALVVCPGPQSALDLLLHPQRLASTLQR